MAMFPDSVSFTLWRQGAGSATDYAIFSSVGGFASGQQLAQGQILTTGSANKLSLTGTFASPQPTTDPVEFRLYGWNAATSTDNSHVVAASMRARFASVAGVPMNPTGKITVQGDFYHLEGGQIAIDLGGPPVSNDYDAINVTGKVELEGDLSVSLVNGFTPTAGNSFNILTATQGIVGQFANVMLPSLPWNLDWRVDYSSTAVALSVVTDGDFNKDDNVNAADYVVWRKNAGSQGEYTVWRANFGTSVASGSSAFNDSVAAVPEPGSASLVVLIAALGIWRRRRIRRISRAAGVTDLAA
jgi:hypothetical protein